MNTSLPIIEPILSELQLSTVAVVFFVVIGVLCIATVSFLVVHFKKRNAYRSIALKQLDKIQQHDSEALSQINAVLKWTALQVFSRKEVAPLYGEAWFTWLNGKTNKPVFSNILLESVLPKLYSGNREKEVQVFQDFKKASIDFIKHHGV